VQFSGGGSWSNSYVIPLGIEQKVALPANPRRLSLSIYQKTNLPVRVWTDNWRNVPAPLNGLDVSGGFLLYSNNAPNGLRYDYRDYGPMMQRQISVESSNVGNSIELYEVCCDCPMSDRFSGKKEPLTMDVRYYLGGVTFPVTSLQMLPGNSNRVGLYIRRVGGGYTDIRLGGMEQQNTAIRHQSPAALVPLNYGQFGDTIGWSAGVDMGTSGGGSFSVIELIKVQ
jgi:hypothetical protein